MTELWTFAAGTIIGFSVILAGYYATIKLKHHTGDNEPVTLSYEHFKSINKVKKIHEVKCNDDEQYLRRKEWKSRPHTKRS